MKRREFLQGTVLGAAALSEAALAKGGAAPGKFPLEETTIAQLSAAMASGKLTSRALCQQYLARIEALNAKGPKLGAIIEVNPDALSIADALDHERKTKGARGPLHGIPVVIKDNIDTADRMATTAGSLALEGVPTPKDAFIVQRLRAAGAVILAKSNLSEWANIRSSASTSGWSGRGGFTRNPYALDRNPSGSSSGSGCAASANLCAIAVGTETDGSIVSPSSVQGLVGLKPTVGLVSRTGIIPISASQDTAGPMARTVTDAALLLNALVGDDPEDPAMKRSGRKVAEDYSRFLTADGLRGKRLGVIRKPLGQQVGLVPLFDRALAELRSAGAEVVDNLEQPGGPGVDDAELAILLIELKAGLAEYLAKRRPRSPLKSLADVIAFNRQHADRELSAFGQDLFEQAQAKGGLDSPEYKKAVATCASMAQGIDAMFAQHTLDALVTLASGPAWLTDPINGDHGVGSGSSIAAVPGYPSITVPMGALHGLPLGLLLIGRAWTEGALLSMAFAYEQATHHRTAPRFVPSVTFSAGGAPG